MITNSADTIDQDLMNEEVFLHLMMQYEAEDEEDEAEAEEQDHEMIRKAAIAFIQFKNDFDEYEAEVEVFNALYLEFIRTNDDYYSREFLQEIYDASLMVYFSREEEKKRSYGLHRTILAPKASFVQRSNTRRSLPFLFLP